MIEVLAGLLAQAVLLLGIAPLLGGLSARASAVLSGRTRRPLLQEYYDLWKWLRKAPVRAAWATAVSDFGVPLVLAATLAAGLLLPTAGRNAPLGDTGDAVAFLALLLLARLAQALIAFDAGEALDVTDINRALAIGALVEPIMLLALFSVAAREGTTSLATLSSHGGLANAGYALAFVALFLLALAERAHLAERRSRGMRTGLDLPVEAGGRDAAFLHWAALVRHLLILTLIIDLFLPWGLGLTLPIGLLVYLGKLVLLSAALALADEVRPLLHLRTAVDLVAVAGMLVLLGLATQAVLHA